MTARKDELKDKLEALALQLAADAAAEGVQIENRNNAMKTLTLYYTATRKLKLKLPEEGDGEVYDFEKAKRDLREAGG